MLIEATGAAPAVEVDLPPDFHAVPLDVSTQARTTAQLEVLDDLLVSDAQQREALSLYMEGLAARVAHVGLGGAAFCAVRLDGRPSTATLTVTVHRIGTADGAVATYGAAEALRATGRFASVRVDDLGTSVVATAVGDRPPAASDSAGAPASAALREVLTLVSLPGTDHAVMLTLSTPCRDDWQVYADLARSIAGSVRIPPARSRSEPTRVAF